MPGSARNGQRDDMDRAANGRDPMSDPTILHLLQAMEKRQDRHEADCSEERRNADRQRSELRAEMREGLTEIKASISKLHDRVNGVIETAHTREGMAWGWRQWLLTACIAVLVAVVGYLLVEGRPWAGP